MFLLLIHNPLMMKSTCLMMRFRMTKSMKRLAWMHLEVSLVFSHKKTSKVQSRVQCT